MTSRVNVDAHALAVKVTQGEKTTIVKPHTNENFYVVSGETLTVEEIAEETKSEGEALKVPLKKPASAAAPVEQDKQTTV